MQLSNIKQISILSLILGTLLGLSSLIPYIGILSFLMCMFFLGAAVILYMQNLKILGELETKEMAIYGAISGFLGFIGFSISFIPLSAIVGLIVKTAYYYSILIMVKSGFFMVLFMVIAIATVAAIMNCFGSMSTSYLIKFYKTEVKK